MKCIKCNVEIGQPKKHEIINCRCGAKLMAVEINKKLEIFNLRKDDKNVKL